MTRPRTRAASTAVQSGMANDTHPTPPAPSKRCSICQHPKSKEINRALLAGSSGRDIERQYGLSDSAVSRHRLNCIPAASAAAIHAKSLIGQGIEIGDAVGEVIEQARTLYVRALRLLDEAETAAALDNGGDLSAPSVLAPKDWGAITKMFRETRGTLELFAKLTGALGATAPKDILRDATVVEFINRLAGTMLTTLLNRLEPALAQQIMQDMLAAIEAEKRAAVEAMPPQDRRLLGKQ
mgnify:FL=1